jgi:hypothetical protein
MARRAGRMRRILQGESNPGGMRFAADLPEKEKAPPMGGGGMGGMGGMDY